MSTTTHNDKVTLELGFLHYEGRKVQLYARRQLLAAHRNDSWQRLDGMAGHQTKLVAQSLLEFILLDESSTEGRSP